MRELHWTAKTEQKLALGGWHSANALALLFGVSSSIYENLNQACHIKYVVTPFKMIIELQKYILNEKHDNELQDY